MVLIQQNGEIFVVENRCPLHKMESPNKTSWSTNENAPPLIVTVCGVSPPGCGGSCTCHARAPLGNVVVVGAPPSMDTDTADAPASPPQT